MDIPSFLRTYPPFDHLDDDRLAEVVRHTRIEFHPAGDTILRQSGEPSRYLYVVRTGAVEVLDGTDVVDLLGEGEVFGQFSLLSGLGPAFSIRAGEDTICYLVDADIAESVMGTRSGLAFLSQSLRRREIRAIDGIDPERVDPWKTHVRALVRRPLVTAPATVTIREAAELMTRERVSSLLVERDGGFGILTDRDLRTRVIALGRSPDTSIDEVLTWPVITVPSETLVADVSGLMLERGIHHVPVQAEDGSLIGVVTDVDIMGLEHKTPFMLKVDVERATNRNEVIRAAHRLPETVVSLVEANLDPIQIAHAVTVVVDTLTRRLLDLAIHDLGDPPCPWAWLALGSEARQEQALVTDQDNALVIDPRGATLEEADRFFERLAGSVNGSLAEAGFPKCKAGVIASNRQWRGTVATWEDRFRRWIGDPGGPGSLLTNIAFDYRPVAGPLEVRSVLDDAIRSARAAPRFMRFLGKLAIEGRPPSGFLRDAVIESRGTTALVLDVKRDGITLIVNLARFWAIDAGLTENRTINRLRDSVFLGEIPEELQVGLEEAFRLLWQVRFEHQSQQARQQHPPDDFVDARVLGPLARQGLKEAFRMIERGQLILETGLAKRR